MTSPKSSRSEIYDLGYRNYEGPRRGRAAAVRALGAHSIRSIFGLGRGVLPKSLAFGLAFIAFLPAVVQLVGGAVGGDDFEFIEPHEFYGVIQIVMVLFVAAMASDLVGNDRKNNTLVLYFSRPIERDDYALAKTGSLAIALLSMTLLPQLLGFVGNLLGSSDSTQWFADNAIDLLWITVVSVLVSAQLASIGMLLASFSQRRAFAMIGVLGFFVSTFVATSILVDLLDRGWAAAVMLASPLYVMQATSLVLFDAVPALRVDSSTGEPADHVAFAELPGGVWIVALVVQTTLALGLTIWRYRNEP